MNEARPTSGWVEPDDQVLSAPVWCFHPNRARISRDTPWFCVICGEEAWIGEDNATEEIHIAGANKEADKRESFLDFLFGGLGKA